MCDDIVCRVAAEIGDEKFTEMMEALQERWQHESGEVLALTLMAVLRTVGKNELTLDAATSTDVLLDHKMENVKLHMEHQEDGSLRLWIERLSNRNPEDSLEGILKMFGL